MRHALLFFIASVMLAALAGCETVKGIGRDITGAGESLQRGLASRKTG